MGARPDIRLTIRPMGHEEYVVDLTPGKDRFLIGRRTRRTRKLLDIALKDLHVSARHCEIWWDDAKGAWFIDDLNTTNGTTIDGDPLISAVALPENIDIQMGTTVIRARYLAADEPRLPAAAETDHEAEDESPAETAAAPVPTSDVEATAMFASAAGDGDVESTLTVSRPKAEAVVPSLSETPAAETPVAGPVVDREAVTFAAPPDEEDTPGDEDATVIRDDRAEPGAPALPPLTMPPHGPRDRVPPPAKEPGVSLGFRPLPPEDEGAPAPSEEETFVPDAEGATLVAPTGDEADDAGEEDATVVAEAGADDATLVASEEPVRDATLAAGPEPEVAASTVTPVTLLAPRPAASGDETPTVRAAEAAEGPPLDIKGIALDLMQSNLIDRHMAVKLRQTARETGRTFFRCLAEDTSVRYKNEIYKFVAEKRGIELIDDEELLRQQGMSSDWLSYGLASTKGAMLVSGCTDDLARYVTIDPFDMALDDWIRRCSGARHTDVSMAPPDVFSNTTLKLKNLVAEGEEGEVGIAINISIEEEHRLQSEIENVDVPQIVNYFLHRGFTQGASDIHIEATEEMLLVRNRVDGILHEDTTMPMSLHPPVASRIKIMSNMDVAEKRRPQDGRVGAVIRDTPIDVRVSSFPTVYGEKIVMRLLDKNALRPDPEQLGLLARDLRLLKDKINAPFGLLMISGPTGSGKTTTLYSCLGSVDKKAKNVLTVEDPVEYRLKGVHQMQVNEKIGLTFASGLRTILRQDPDIVMIGECRDTETASMAVQASLTGHIVFSTIHTNDAVGVVTRLLDMGIDPFLVANSLSLAMAQRLVRRVCTRCQIEVPGDQVLEELRDDGISDERLEKLGIEVDPYLTYLKGAGCLHCRNTGYSGRQAVFELFEMTGEARNLVMSQDFNADKLREMAQNSGMTTLISHGMHLIEDGVTTHQEVVRVLGEAY